MITKLTLGSYATNTYIYYDEPSRHAVIIDPAAKAERILAKVEELALEVKAILLTHGHFDHTGASNEVREALDVPVYASKHDAELAADPDRSAASLIASRNVPVVDKFLQEGEMSFGDITMQILATPGHTAGSLCFYIPHEGVLFSGDTLFEESYGRYDLPSGDLPTLIGSLNRLLALPAETKVYPGHEGATTIGHERTHNPIKRP